MQRAAFWVNALACVINAAFGIINGVQILLGRVSPAYTGVVLLTLVIAALCGVIAMLLARSCRVDDEIDLQTELQAQLAAEMIRKRSLTKLEITEKGGMTVNSRLGS